jgi:hypothetical protein
MSDQRMARGALNAERNIVSVMVCDTFYSSRKGVKFADKVTPLSMSEEVQEMSDSE